MKPVRTRLSTEARQTEIVGAVLRLAGVRSPGLITTSDIAGAVGLSQGAVFRHFPTKDAIWLAVMDWVEDQLLTLLEAAAGNAVAPLPALEAVFMAHVNFVVAWPGVPRLIFSELQRADDTPVKARVRGLLKRYRQLLMGLLQAAARDELLADGLDQAAAATLFIGSIQGLVMQSMLAGTTDRMVLEAAGTFKLYLRAIGRPA